MDTSRRIRSRDTIAKLVAIGIAAAVTVVALGLSGCEHATLAEQSVQGPTPTLAAPKSTLIPTVNVASAKGWPDGAAPQAAPGLAVNAFAKGLDHPRWVYVLPNGDVLVAETDAPPKPDDGKGFKGPMMKLFMKKAGAGVPSANRITLLRDSKGNGVADTRTVFLRNLNSPFGMVLVGNGLYVACTDSILRFPYTPGATEITAPGEKIVDLPAGTINHHWTKNVIASPDGSRLYVTVGSNSNVAENGLAAEESRAAILEVDLVTRRSRVFASGLRNPTALAWQPGTNTLWTSVNERDNLGDDLVPDYFTSVKEGAFYGWPFAYIGQNYDPIHVGKLQNLVKTAVVPDVLLPAHSAALGATFYTGTQFPQRYRNGAFVAMHGSWNRSKANGYRVGFVPFQNGKAGAVEDFLTGFVINDGAEGQITTWGRPVGVTVGRDGSLLVSDDGGNRIWKVSYSQARK